MYSKESKKNWNSLKVKIYYSTPLRIFSKFVKGCEALALMCVNRRTFLHDTLV